MGEDKEMVLVKWHDARFYQGTYSKQEILELKMCLFESLGYLVTQTDTITRIASELNDESQYRDITLIPTGSIISIQKLSTVFSV
jgi:hypothetical protein